MTCLDGAKQAVDLYAPPAGAHGNPDVPIWDLTEKKTIPALSGKVSLFLLLGQASVFCSRLQPVCWIADCSAAGLLLVCGHLPVQHLINGRIASLQRQQLAGFVHKTVAAETGGAQFTCLSIANLVF